MLNPEFVLTVLAALAGLGAILFIGGLVRLRRRRLLSGSGEAVGGVILVVLGLGAGAAAANLYTYHRLTAEQPVAQLRFHQAGSQAYDAELRLPDGSTRHLALQGDEWQLDARILKWEGLAILGGATPRFRLERLSGRYRDLQQARTGPYTVHQLTADAGLDLWSLARRHQKWMPWIDAIYGSGVFMPMADGAEYEVTIAPAGLVVRPANAAARESAADWR